jgi:predicted glutamine amidotransferase
MKNLDPDEVEQLIAQLEGEIVIHFRLASVGGVDPLLCHPFPTDRQAGTKLSGSAKRLLFHNGTWSDWRRALDQVLDRDTLTKLTGPMSDSRSMALLVHAIGTPALLESLPGRMVLFGAKTTKFFGSWQSWGGMLCSNLGFVYQVERQERWENWASKQPATQEGEQLGLFATTEEKP